MLASSGYVACMGCGVCVAHCPQEAICLVRELARGTLLEIRELTARVTSES
jgi:ferredoxin